MGVRLIRTKGISILDRYELTSYADRIDEECGRPDWGRKITYRFYDTKEKKEIELVDNGGDGIDEVTIDGKPVSGEAAASPNHAAIFEAARREVALRIPAYLKEFQDVYRPESIGKKTLDVSTGGIEASLQGGKRQNFYFDVYGEKSRFGMKVSKKGGEDFGDILLSATDRETGFSFSLDIDRSDPFVSGAAKYLSPLVRLIGGAPDGSGGWLSGAWLQFLQSKDFDALDGHVGDTGGASETDWALAGALLMDADKQPRTVLAHSPEAAMSLLGRYKGERTPDAIRAFMKAEQEAASALNDSIRQALPPFRLAYNDLVMGQFYIDAFGGLKWSSLVESATEAPGYIFAAIESLLEKYSKGRFKLRERTFQYLAKTLSAEPDRKLVFTDQEQTGSVPFEFPPVALLNLIYGGFNRYGPGISVDGYFFHDADGDGKIQVDRDVITQKWVNFGIRHMSVVFYDEMMKDVGAKHPPPFDPSQFNATGVPLSRIRAWSENVANEFIKRKHLSADPLEDGAYRVFIYRAGKNDLDPGSLWMSAFLAFNDYDDFYVVPPTWGMEAALNEVAARGIPIDEIYIGSHTDVFEFGDIVLDYDRRLIFAKGARVYFTGCYTNPYMAEIMGAQLFGDSAGVLRFADGFNIPTPFGGVLSSGEYYTARFKNGRMEDISHRPLVDPIHGGLF